MLHKGEPIPDISLLDQDEKLVSLASFKGTPIVIYFYPKNNTRFCTAQACGFRDHYEDFQKAGAEVIGISKDSTESHRNVANNRNLPFILLSDPNREALKAFRIPLSFFGLLSGRVTFVVDKFGRVAHTFRADFNADQHIKEALSVLRNL